MNAPIALVACAAGALLFTQSARGASITIDALGGPVNLQSGAIAGLLDSAPGNLSTSDLQAVHAELDASGIETDSMVTFLLADTASGVSFITLVDDARTDDDSVDAALAQLGMTTVGSLHNSAWVNDHSLDITTLLGAPGASQIAAGTFNWSESDGGDAFAWSGLAHGDGLTYNFMNMGADALRDTLPFQFLSFMNDTWTAVDFAGFNEADQFAFSATISMVPVPAPLGIGLVGLAGLLVRRRMQKQL